MAKIHRCGLYIRVSTEEQAQKTEGSLKTQRELLDAFVKDKVRHAEQFDTGEEWTVYDYYTEEPKSAKDTKRPHYQRLMSDIEAGNVNTILFTEISRLSRSTRDFLELGEFLKQHDADFICLRHPELNTATPHGRALLTMLVAMMAFEREINAERSGISFVARSARGLWTGGQLLGYDLSENKGHLIVNDAEKKIVKFIFETYAETGSVHEVTKRCRQYGYKTKTYQSRREHKHHGRDFSYSSVKQALQNIAYVAKKELGRPRREKGKDGKRKLVPSKVERKIITTDCWKPIIEQDLFYKVQGMLAQSKRSRMPAKPAKGDYVFLLGQTIFCNPCREMMTHGGTQKDGGVIPYYTHRKDRKADSCILPPNINARRLDEVVWERVARNLNDADLKRWAEEAIEAERAKGTDAIKAEITEMNIALKAKRDSHTNILGGFGGGKVDPETTKMLGVLSEDIASLRARLAEKKKELAVAKQEASSGKPKTPARMRATALKDLDNAQKRDLLKMLIRRVELTPNSIVLNPFEGDPIVGEVKERRGVRSGRWRFIDVEWLN